MVYRHYRSPPIVPAPPCKPTGAPRQALDLSAQLSEAIKALSQHQGVTLFMTLLAAFRAFVIPLLWTKDIAVGCSHCRP